MKEYANQYMLIFNSSNKAILLYNEMKKTGLIPVMITTPCGLRRGCSQSIIIPIEDIEKVVKAAKDKDIKVVNIYKLVSKNNEITYEPIKRKNINE